MPYTTWAAIPRLRIGTRAILSCHSTISSRSQTISHIRPYRNQPTLPYSVPPRSKIRYLRVGLVAITCIGALCGLYSLYDGSDRYMRLVHFFPIYVLRIQRAIARKVNMEDLDEAMDHYLDIFHSVFSSQLGLVSLQHEEGKFFLESVSSVAQSLGPEVAAGLLSLVQEACIHISSLPVVNKSFVKEHLDEHVEFVGSLAALLCKYAIDFQGYLIPHMARHIKEVQEADRIRMEVLLVDPPQDDEETAIDR